MKYNKIFLGLGVTAIALTSCHDDPEYQPAAPVTNPAAYFSMTDNTAIDLGETDTQFAVTLYRAETGEASTVDVTTTLTDENGSDAAGIFTIPSSVTFEKGSATAEYVVTFDINNLQPLLTYDFKLKVAGENSPYYLTENTIQVAYTPWEDIADCSIYDYALLCWSTNPREMLWNVKVQKHPSKKGFFRIKNPYAEYPVGEYEANPDDTEYLYVNATKPNEVFFSDAQGKPIMFFDTHVGIFDGMGTMVISTPYSAYLLDKAVEWEGKKVGDASIFATWGGKYVEAPDGSGYVQFTDNMLIFINGYQGFQQARGWQLRLNGNPGPTEWVDLGEGTYTDGFLGEMFYEESAATYGVSVQQHIENPALYKLIRPYGAGIWPFGDAAATAKDIVIDTTNPEMVLIELQEALTDAAGQLGVTNAAAIYLNGYIDETKTEAQIMKEGLNDVMKDGVIHINHPSVLDYNAGQIYFLWMDSKLTPGKLVLPTAEASANATKAPKAFNGTSDELKLAAPSTKSLYPAEYFMPFKVAYPTK